MRFESELGRPSLGRAAKTRAVNTRLNASQMEKLEERARQEHKTPSELAREGIIIRNAWPHIRRASMMLDVLFEVVYRGELLAAQTPEFSHHLYDEMADIVQNITTDEVIKSEGKSAEEAAKDAYELLQILREWVRNEDVEAGVEHTLQVIDSVFKPG